jgi:cell wall-associated NlpC family hydrolase
VWPVGPWEDLRPSTKLRTVFVAHPVLRLRSLPIALGVAAAFVVASAAPASAQGPGGAAALVGDDGTVAAAPGATPQQPLPVGGAAPSAPAAAAVDGEIARLAGVQALAPTAAPAAILAAVTAANAIVGLPYKWGGGHGSFEDSGYDCSGAVSKVLNAIGALDDPLDSRALRNWGEAGRGRWITVYTNPSHAYVVVAGLRFDTSGRGGKGPRWRAEPRPSSGFAARHPDSL